MIKIRKRSASCFRLFGYCGVFCPAFYKDSVLVKRNWLTSCVSHWSHPKDGLCLTNSYACSIGDASFWIKDKCFSSLPTLNRFYTEYIWTKRGTDLYA